MNEIANKKTESVTLCCEKHGDYTGDVETFNFPDGGTETFYSMCPECERESSEKDRRERDEEDRRIAISKWQSMNIEPLFYGATLDNFNAHNPELKKHLEICRSFSENPKGKLVMIGKNGNGKTHLAISILKKLGGVIYTAYEIGILLRRSYNGDTKEWEVFEELNTVPLLVIDEVEKIKESESKQNWVSYVVGKRYNRMLPIIFIGNCHIQKDCKEGKKPCPKCLEYHLENDVLSRILEDGIIMKFNSDDYRKKIKDSREEAK